MSLDHQQVLRERLAQCAIYGILDESLFEDRLPLAIAEQWLAAGIKIIQLRAKSLITCVWLDLVKALQEECAESNALLIINDRLDLALMGGADGVHLGEYDAPIEDVRRVAPGMLIGGTARNVKAALALEASGADYLGCGSVFASSTKPGLPVIGTDGLAEICRAVSIPVLAIGGIGAEQTADCLRAGATGVCMIQGLATPAGLASASMAARCKGDGS